MSRLSSRGSVSGRSTVRGGSSSTNNNDISNEGRERQANVNYEELKRVIHDKLIDKLDLSKISSLDTDTIRREIRLVAERLCDTENPLLNRMERERLIDEVMDAALGLGPLEILLKDPTISDILINGPSRVFVERRGKMELSDVKFRNNEHLMQIIDRIVSKVGRRVDETSPMVDARLADGSRVNAIIPPLALDGASVSIRRFGANPLRLEDLLNYKAFTPEMAMLMEAAIKARLNIIISGGTGCGKTTLLNTLSSFIPSEDRVITIEDAAELQLQQEHIVRLETRPANIEGKGAVMTRDLVRNALHAARSHHHRRVPRFRSARHAPGDEHRPRRLDDHAAREHAARCPARLETMIMMAGLELPIKAMRQQISSAVDVIIQANRLQGGPRKVTCISEVMGMEQDIIVMQEIFRYRQMGIDPNARIGQFEATGVRPSFVSKIEAAGIVAPPTCSRNAS